MVGLILIPGNEWHRPAGKFTHNPGSLHEPAGSSLPGGNYTGGIMKKSTRFSIVISAIALAAVCILSILIFPPVRDAIEQALSGTLTFCPAENSTIYRWSKELRENQDL